MEKKKEMDRIREESQKLANEELDKQGELEELRARVQSLKRRKSEMLEELDNAEKRRKEAERKWKSQVEQMEKEQVVKLNTLSTEIQILRKKQQEVETEWRSRLEGKEVEVEKARMEVQESQTELNKCKTLTEEQKNQLYILTQSNKQLEADRDRVRMALERTESAMIGYRDRAHQQEQNPGAEPRSEEVSAASDWLG